MRRVRNVLFDPLFVKDPFTKGETSEGDEIFVGAAGDELEFRLHVDIGGVVARQVEEEPG